MKKIVLMMALVFGLSNLYAQSSEGIEFFHGSWAEVKAQAKKENKNIFIDCYTVWCGPCKMLSKKVFPQKIVGDYFNANFISYKVDMEKGEGIQLKNDFEVKAFPTLIFTDAEGEILYKILGSMSAEKLLEEARIAPEMKKKNDKILSNYNKDPNNPEFVKVYLESLIKSRDKKTSDIAEHYISLFPEERYLDDDLFNIIKNVIRNPYAPVVEYFHNNKDKLLEKYEGDEMKVKYFFSPKYFYASQDINAVVRKGGAFDEEAFQNLISLMERRGYHDIDRIVNGTLVKKYEFQKDWPSYVKMVEKIIETPSFMPSYWNNVGKYIVPLTKEGCDDPVILNKGLAIIDNTFNSSEMKILECRHMWQQKIELHEKLGNTEEVAKLNFQHELLDILYAKELAAAMKNKGVIKQSGIKLH